MPIIFYADVMLEQKIVWLLLLALFGLIVTDLHAFSQIFFLYTLICTLVQTQWEACRDQYRLRSISIIL